jgi:hypothetical protein
VQKKSLTFLLLAFGIALLFAGLFFDIGAADSAREAGNAHPDRLAEPTPPPSSQADHGAGVLAFVFTVSRR